MPAPRHRPGRSGPSRRCPGVLPPQHGCPAALRPENPAQRPPRSIRSPSPRARTWPKESRVQDRYLSVASVTHRACSTTIITTGGAGGLHVNMIEATPNCPAYRQRGHPGHGKRPPGTEGIAKGPAGSASNPRSACAGRVPSYKAPRAQGYIETARAARGESRVRRSPGDQKSSLNAYRSPLARPRSGPGSSTIPAGAADRSSTKHLGPPSYHSARGGKFTTAMTWVGDDHAEGRNAR